MKRITLAVALVSVATLSAQIPATQGAGADAGRGRGAGAGRATTATRGATAPPPAAPAAGSPGTYKPDTDLMDVLKRDMASKGNAMSTSSVANTDQYRINVVHRVTGAGAIAHPGWSEVHHIIDGGATFVTGGTIVRPPPGSPAGTVASIEGGVDRHVGKGDVVIIPENSPHWYKDVDAGGVTYLEVRFLAPKK